MSHYKDTDYLSLSTRIRALENRLLTRERMERMIEAKDHVEAVKVLSECGYGDLPKITGDALEAVLAQVQSEVFRDLSAAVPDVNLIDVFRIKYDYHNAKSLIKAEGAGVDATRLLMGGGRYEPQELEERYRKDDLRVYSQTFYEAIVRAKEALSATGDPQVCDFILDRACYAELSDAAQRTGSDFVKGYVSLMIDIINLRCAVRASRLNKGSEFLQQVLLPGGNVEVQTFARTRGEDLARLFTAGLLSEASVLGAEVSAPHSGSLTAFERACDNTLTAYISKAKRVPFGEQVVMAYLYARESELTAIRTIMSGRMAGLDGDIIRERLRESYV